MESNFKTRSREAVRQRLEELAEPGYRDFNMKLLPGVEDVLGVRTPLLRRMAREIVGGRAAAAASGETWGWQAYISQVKEAWEKGEACYEERLLWGMVIGSCRQPWETVEPLVREFVPAIDNWAVCDGFCSSLKIAASCQDQVWEFLQTYLKSGEEYDNRFGAVMLLCYYVDDDHVEAALQALDQIENQGYYAKMAVAWTVSIFYVKLPEQVLPYLKENHLDDWTHNKALQKICESLRPDKETKAMIRGLKR